MILKSFCGNQVFLLAIVFFLKSRQKSIFEYTLKNWNYWKTEHLLFLDSKNSLQLYIILQTIASTNVKTIV